MACEADKAGGVCAPGCCVIVGKEYPDGMSSFPAAACLRRCCSLLLQWIAQCLKRKVPIKYLAADRLGTMAKRSDRRRSGSAAHTAPRVTGRGDSSAAAGDFSFSAGISIRFRRLALLSVVSKDSNEKWRETKEK